MEQTEHQPGRSDGEALLRRERDLIDYQGPDRVISSREFWEIENKKPVTSKAFLSQIPTLDKHLQGFESGELVVISGPTGQGKTTLCDTLGRSMATDGAKCLWFSFEVTPAKFLEKYKTPESPVIYIPMDKKTGSFKWIEQKVYEAKLKYDCRVVFIDHLHFVVDMANMKNPSLEIGSVMRALKTEIALKHNVLVFLISHLQKVKLYEEPSENDLRDSSFVAQESDIVLIVYRRLDEGKNDADEMPYGNRARLLICKSRRTGVYRARVPLVKIGDSLVEEMADEGPKW